VHTLFDVYLSVSLMSVCLSAGLPVCVSGCLFTCHHTQCQDVITQHTLMSSHPHTLMSSHNTHSCHHTQCQDVITHSVKDVCVSGCLCTCPALALALFVSHTNIPAAACGSTSVKKYRHRWMSRATHESVISHMSQSYQTCVSQSYHIWVSHITHVWVNRPAAAP